MSNWGGAIFKSGLFRSTSARFGGELLSCRTQYDLSVCRSNYAVLGNMSLQCTGSSVLECGRDGLGSRRRLGGANMAWDEARWCDCLPRLSQSINGASPSEELQWGF